MTRIGMVAIVAIFAMVTGFSQAGGAKDKAKEKAKEKDVLVNGKFTKDDPVDERGGPSQTHIVPLKAGSVYTIDMMSTDVDSFLRLLDEKGKQLDEDDDSGGDLNSRIIFSCSKDGNYKLVCTTFAANKSTGSYSLTVKSSGSAPKPTNAHVQLVGKPAPDVEADFAINGKAVKLADLKGKVVLLHFWDVRSSSCVGLLPQLNDWNKVYKKQGLAIVGLTFYPSDINQRLRFDMDGGKLLTVAKADRKSDQAMLGAFASHHKVDYLLLPLAKQCALDAFGAYAVNGVPQLVLIDRQGMIRLVDVGSEKNRANIESELRKLLADK